MKERIKYLIEESINTKKKVVESNVLIDTLYTISNLIMSTLKQGNKLILVGNGGSAADCQHIAAEFVGRFQKERRSLAAIALTTDTSAITAIANDYSFREVFSRQVEGLGNKGDILIAISTSGNAENVIEAVNMAKTIGVLTIGLTGKDGGVLKKITDYSVIVPSEKTARIQECHILIGHILCELVEEQINE